MIDYEQFKAKGEVDAFTVTSQPKLMIKVSNASIAFIVFCRECLRNKTPKCSIAAINLSFRVGSFRIAYGVATSEALLSIKASKNITDTPLVVQFL